MRVIAATLFFLMIATPADAGLSRAELATVYVGPPPNARLDPALSARDAMGHVRSIGGILAGRPAFVTFVDYTCNTLCGTDLELLSLAIARDHLIPSAYRILIIGIDPKDNADAALAMKRKEIAAALWPATTVLLPSAKVIGRATAALGFHYAYDPAIDQYAHPAVVYVIGPDGALRSTLSPFALGTADLRQALAKPGAAPGLFERVRLLCYAYDPATGIYSLRIVALLRVACIMMVLLIAGAMLFLLYRGRRAA